MDILTEDGLLFMILMAPGALLSLSIHEFAHARTALAFGDRTALQQGRVSLNPLVHLDPMGTLCLLFAGFGWARPVPVDSSQLHPRKWGDIAVSLAGPGSNLILALLCMIALRVMGHFGVMESGELGRNAFLMVAAAMVVNVALLTFNLLPLFPLDGHHVIREMLPAEKQYDFMRWQVQYGRIVLLVLILGPRLLVSDNSADLPAWLDPIGLLIDRAMALAFMLYSHPFWDQLFG
jgi:Zn-dependent protease